MTNYFDFHQLTSQDRQIIITLLKKGRVGILPTDTMYGIVGSALIPGTVEKIYKLRKRTADKPMIILISSIEDLNKFEVKLSKNQRIFLKNIWPNPVSVVLSCLNPKFTYLHRGKNSLAFRIPSNNLLREMISCCGPIVAPSANLEGMAPSQTIKEAKRYFGNKVAFLVDGGKIDQPPSTLIQITGDSIKVLRQGNFNLQGIVNIH